MTLTLSACGIFNRQAEPATPVTLPPPVIEIHPEPIVMKPLPQAGLVMYDTACSQKDAGKSSDKQLCFSVRIGQLTPNKKAFLKGPVAGYFGRFALPNCAGNETRNDIACQEDHRIAREQLVSAIRDWGKLYRDNYIEPTGKTNLPQIGYLIEGSVSAKSVLQGLPGTNKQPVAVPFPGR